MKPVVPWQPVDVAKGSLVAFVTRIVAILFLAALSAVAARTLPVAEFGAFRTATVAIGVTAAVAGSFSVSFGYFVANQRRPEAEVASNGMLLSAAVGLAALFVTVPAALLLDGAYARYALLVGLSVFPIVARSGVGGVFLGANRIVPYVFAANGYGIVALPLFLLWVVLPDRRTAADALAAWIAAQYAALGVLALWGRRWWGWLTRHRPDPALMRRMLSYGSLTGLAGVVSFLNYRIDQLLVAGLDGARGAGIYAAGVTAAEGLWIFSSAVAVATYAPIGSLDRRAAAELAARAVRHTLLLVSALALPLLLFAEPMLAAVFGGTYREAGWALRILVLATLLYAPQGIVSNFYSVQLGRPSIPLALAASSALINVALSFLLIPRIGFVGGAWATFASYAAVSAASVLLFARLAGLPPWELFRLRRSDLRSYGDLLERLRRRMPFARAARPAPGS